MKRHIQKFRHRPELNEIGDCDRTTVACLLNMDIDDVPHWGKSNWKNPRLWDAERTKWLSARGLHPVRFLIGGDDVEDVLNWQAAANPGTVYLLTGTSANLTPHVVICKNDEIIHDPSIDKSGIAGPLINSGSGERYFEIEYFVPISIHILDEAND